MKIIKKYSKTALMLAVLILLPALLFSSCESKSAKNLSCSLLVSCKTVFDNADKLDSNVAKLLPKDGVIIDRKVSFSEGESALDVLMSAAKEDSVQVDYDENGGVVYVAGISNLYAASCGELSGWLYRVNGEFTNDASNEYKVKDGDLIEYVYTCDMGADVGAKLQ